MAFLRWGLAVMGATVVAWVAMTLAFSANAYVGAGLPLAVAGLAALAVAAVRERRNRALIHRRHCLECGAAVVDREVACHLCGSVRLERIAGDTSAARTGRHAPETREMPVAAFSPDRSGAIGWVDGAPPGAEGFTVDEGTGSRRLRIWGVALSALGAALLVFGLSGLLELLS